MDFSWSTPLRRNGQTDLPLIPNEIYLAIFECIAPSGQPLSEQDIETFSALALVCRFFCAVMLPRVFERVVFFGNTTSNRMKAFRKTTWARQIVVNTEPAKSVALYVKECHFKDWCAPKEMQQFLFPFSTLYCRAMACMTNIRKVEFCRSFVKNEHWETMAALKQLDCLQFWYCSFIEDPPDRELSVRTVKLFGSPTSFILRPIATSTLRTLETDELAAVLKIVTARQLVIENFVLHREVFEMKLLLQVFEQLPGLESITFGFRAQVAASRFISGLSLKKLFTRLRSFTVKGPSVDPILRHDTEKLVSALCDGPGTLPSLERLELLFLTTGGPTATLDIVSDRLEGTIIPAFPNVKYVRAPYGVMSLGCADWKRSDWSGASPESRDS
ncbi:hypothetical protein K503DRAFT_799426 [Rhizopogon vinicolor AM-OR11-026]|uniref:F-box domain-containing protein n=1 Tax=Rhizopogon vinicolor AM-OR11-026 TaxID=1314800 RepID=A0A1B7N4B6_9AGAM|nr:hypothetical protein K503DRAFT_799426 [Rhizopogon vinicolor AM-OR11-026]